ncbi:MAG: hypothetical protein AAFX40_04155 [Cyanobacteria bacterium J06639_1]
MKAYRLNKAVFAIALGTAAWGYGFGLGLLGVPSFWPNMVWLVPAQVLALALFVWKERNSEARSRSER